MNSREPTTILVGSRLVSILFQLPPRLITPPHPFCVNQILTPLILPIDVTGSSDSKVGLLAIYDIFGFFPQTQQGADILASNLNAVVAMPDFFEGEPASTDIYPPTTPEKTSALQRFFSTKADLTANQQRVDTVIKALKEEFKGVEKWAVIGCCWGGKVSLFLFSFLRPLSSFFSKILT